MNILADNSTETRFLCFYKYVPILDQVLFHTNMTTDLS
uniref:Uncharacterized protein n=1 Tax=Octopus bimaculoides TaxID=37653 RepID=A0A0L8HED3_OCTBM